MKTNKTTFESEGTEFMSFIHKKLTGRLLSGVACGLLMSAASSTAYADEPIEVGELDEIVVTGTNIRGAEVVGGSVLTIDSETLQRSGRATAADFLRELPSNLAGGVGMSDAVQSQQDVSQQQANLSGGQGVNLRGLGALSTLVLVNGRRMATSGQFGDFVDIANIPTAAIERMEILQDGASAIYGSDAVGGVVNFILKRQVDRPETTFRVGTATEGGGTEILASHVHGFNWDNGHAVVGFEYYNKEAVLATSRDRYSQGSDFTRFGGINWPIYSAHMSPTANIYLNGQGTPSSLVGATVPVGTNANLSMADLLLTPSGVGNSYNVYEGRDLTPAVERFSTFFSFDQELSDGFSIFGDARYSHRTTNYRNGYAALTTHTLSINSPFFIDDIALGLTGDNPADGVGPGGPNADADGILNDGMDIGFGKVITDRLNTSESTVKHFSAQLGFRADLFSDWQGEFTASFSRDDQFRHDEEIGNTDANANTIGCALGNVSAACTDDIIPFNPFSTDPLTAAQIEQYYDYRDLSFDSNVLQFSAKADGSLFELPGGNAKLAVGVDFRREKIDGAADFTTISVAPRAGVYEETVRNAYSAFAELNLPVLDVLDISAAGRYEKFTGTGEYDTFDPKFGVNFTPVEGLKLYASWGTSFHAPAMRFENDSPQPLPGGNAAFILNTSRFAPCDTDLIDLNGLAMNLAGECSFSLLVNSGGAGPGILKPEEAQTWTLGVDFEPEALPGFRASISYFNIKVDNRIQRIQGSQLNGILADFFATNGGGAFRSALIVNPSEEVAQAAIDNPRFLFTFGPPVANTAADIQMIVNATQLNIASLKEEGLDYSVSYDFSLGNATEMGVFAYGTYMTKYAVQDAPGNPFVSYLGQYATVGAPAKLRAKQGIWASQGAFNGRLTANYISGLDCFTCYVPGTGGVPTLSTSAVKIDSWMTIDLDLVWDLSDYGSAFEGARINLQVVNLFNKEAPFLDGGTSSADTIPSAYDPNNHTIMGRTIGLTLTKRW